MSDGGKRFTASWPAKGAASRAGWRDDPERPGIQRYWDGDAWATDIAPRPKPESAWKGARIIAFGILVAAAVIFTVWRFSQPSDAECENQRTEVLLGKRLAVESACIGR